MVHNASQIYIPDGDNRNPYDIGQPQNSSYGNLLQIRSDKNKNGNSIYEFTTCFHEFSVTWNLRIAFKTDFTKGQLISKAIYGVIDSPKKTNEKDLT